MNAKQRSRQLHRRQQHVKQQDAKRRDALDTAVVTVGLHPDKVVEEVMEEQGYKPAPSGWRRIVRPHRKQPRKSKG